MTQTTRIVLNIVATYGRTLYAMAIGIFTSRWLLMSLGEVDYGLLGLVGGLIGFISFFNVFLSGAVGRFYAFAVGQSMIAGKEADGLEECRRWFSLAFALHTIVPIILLVVGYPIGEWAVRNFLTIPPGKIEACVWIFRFACIGCFISIFTVPFSAMYTAKQEIAELTVYGFAQSTILFVFIAWMVNHPGDWLVRYALAGCLIGNIPQLIIMIRAYWCYPECRFRLKYCRDIRGFKKLMSFAGWQAISTFGNMISGQGVAIVVNKYFGPAINASMAIANTVKTHTNSLSGALVQAFMPAITNECGKGDLDKMRRYSFQACKYGLLLVLIFLVPIVVEIDSVITLWLKTPPQSVSFFCICMLLAMLVDKSVCGHHTAIMAVGNIASYQICCGVILASIFPMAWAFTAMGFGALGIGLTFVLDGSVYSLSRLYFAKKYAGMNIGYWMRTIIFPTGVVVGVAYMVSLIPHFLMEFGFLRILVTGVVFEIVYLPLSYFYVLDKDEKSYIISRLKKRLRRH